MSKLLLSKDDPCLERCEHIDCNEMRLVAMTMCPVCKEKIGWDVYIQFTERDGKVTPVHFLCAIEKQHKKQELEAKVKQQRERIEFAQKKLDKEQKELSRLNRQLFKLLS